MADDYVFLHTGPEIDAALDKVDAITDYVVETGKIGNWNYKKFADGQAILWGTQQFNATSQTSWANNYYTNEITISTPFPIADAVLTGTCPSWSQYFTVISTNNSYANQTVSFRAFRPATFDLTQDLSARLQVWGRWK